MIRSQDDYVVALLAFRWEPFPEKGTPLWWPWLDGLHYLRTAQLKFDPDYAIWNSLAPPFFHREPPSWTYGASSGPGSSSS